MDELHHGPTARQGGGDLLRVGLAQPSALGQFVFQAGTELGNSGSPKLAAKPPATVLLPQR